MKNLTKFGILLLIIGLSFFASTIYRSGSTDSFSYVMRDFLSLDAYSWSGKNETNTGKPSFWAPRDLRMEVKANSTIDVYILNGEGMRLWASEGKLLPVRAFKEVTNEIFTLKLVSRGQYYFLIYNPTNSSAAFEIHCVLYGFEKDLLWMSIGFIVAGTFLTSVSFLVAKTSNVQSKKRFQQKQWCENE